MKRHRFDHDMLRRLQAVAPPGTVIETLGIGRPNAIVAVDDQGLLVETERSTQRAAGPQLVPAWMVNVAWDHLQRTGRLSNQELVNELNVKRSAFVCALLSRFPEVEIASVRPIQLMLRGSSRDVRNASER